MVRLLSLNMITNYRSTGATNRIRALLLPALLVAIVSLAAACGNDDGDSTASPEAAEATSTPTEAPEETVTAAPETATPDMATPEADDTAMQVVQTSFGEVEVPVNPQRVIALDAIAALMMVSVGLEPLIYADPNGATILQQILGERGIEIFNVGDGMSGFDVEEVAVRRPDLIILTADEGFEASLGPITEVAPTVILPFRAPWRDLITDTGAVFDRNEEAAAVVAALEGRVAEVSDVVAENPTSLSILGQTFGIVLAMSMDSVVSNLAEEVGLDRPVAQAEGEPSPAFPYIIDISAEVLADHDADFIAVLAGIFYDEELFIELPTFDFLQAVQEDRWGMVDGDLWFGTHPFAVYWMLEDFEAIALGEGEAGIGTIDDTGERWAGFLELIG